MRPGAVEISYRQIASVSVAARDSVLATEARSWLIGRSVVPRITSPCKVAVVKGQDHQFSILLIPGALLTGGS